jgi:ribosomal protein S18 acetylase RimI-like enzyme
MIRAARPDDAGLLARWAIAMAWETEHKRLDPDTVARGVRMVFEQPARGRYFVAERAAGDGMVGDRGVDDHVVDDRSADDHIRDDRVGPVGMLMLTLEWSDWRCGDWWWIQSVYIDPAHRRQGVYRALYEHVHALAQATPQVCGLRLYVERDNANAQRTYASLGMVDAGYAMFEAEFARHRAL